MTIIFTQTSTTISQEFIESVTVERLNFHLSRIAKESGVEFGLQGDDKTKIHYSVIGHWDAINLAYKSLFAILKESSNYLHVGYPKEKVVTNLTCRKMDKIGDPTYQNISLKHNDNYHSNHSNLLKELNQANICVSIKKEPDNDYCENSSPMAMSSYSKPNRIGSDTDSVVNCPSTNISNEEVEEDFVPESKTIKVEKEDEINGEDFNEDTDIDESYLSNSEDENEISDSFTENVDATIKFETNLGEAKFKKLRKNRYYGPGDFQCDHCAYVGKTEDYLKRHMQRHTFRFTCDLCSKGFGFKSEYVRHYKAHIKKKQKYGEDKDEYSCDLCPYVTKTRMRFKTHIKRMHIKKFTCNICGKKFGTGSGLSRHENVVHSAPQYSCNQCPKTYKDKRSLKEHLKTHALDYVEPNFPCDICGKSYKSKLTLSEHRQSHMDGYVKPNIPCEICGKSFSQKCALTQHIKSDHLGIKKAFLCPTCGKSCKSKSAYMAHAADHLGIKPYVCEKCGKAFSDERLLKEHKESHNPEKPFQCEICEKSFKRKTGLRMHLKVHAESKEFMCPICGKGFTQKQALERHERIHTGAKPYLCSLCNKSFNDTSIIRRHMILVHKKQPELWREGVVEELAKVSQKDNINEIYTENMEDGESEPSSDIKSLEKWCYKNPPLEYRWNKLEINDKLYQQKSLYDAFKESRKMQQDKQASNSMDTGFSDHESLLTNLDNSQGSSKSEESYESESEIMDSKS